MMNIFNKMPYGKSASSSIGALCTVSVVALLCSFSSYADSAYTKTYVEKTEQQKSEDVDDKWYVGAPLVDVQSKDESLAQDNTSVSVTNVAVDDSRNGWKVNVEFDLSEHFAIGAAYVDLQDVELDINAIGNNSEQKLFSPGRKIMANSADGFTLESIYHYNLSDNLGLTGSIGVFNWQGDFQNQSLSVNPQSKSNPSDSGTDVYFGLGGGYQLTEDMTLEVNWEHYKLDNEATQMWSIGLNYHFK